MVANPTIDTHILGSYVPKALQHKRKTLNDEYNLLRLRRPCLNNIIEGGSAYQEDNRKYIVKATSGSSFKSESDPHASHDPKINLHPVKKFLAVMYKFCYPHLIAIRVSYSMNFLENNMMLNCYIWLIFNLI